MSSPFSRKIWDEIVKAISPNIPPQDLELWIRPLSPIRSEGDNLFLRIPNELHAGIVKERYEELLQSTALSLGQKLQFVVDGKSSEKTLPPPTAFHHPDLNPDYVFSNFIVGSTNQFAYSASLEVIKSAGKKYNPLFLYGGVGTGKTHLLHAIGNELLRQHPRYRVIYLTSDQFTQAVVHAVRFDKLSEIYDRYARHCDLLLFEDIQLLKGRKRTQMEFIRIFNTLFERNKQIVLTSDNPPGELGELDGRLRDRFESGLVVDIQPPDFDLRLKILTHKIRKEGLEISEEVSDYLARAVTTSVRELEGSLNRLLARARFEGRKVTLEFARSVLKEYQRSVLPQISVGKIIKVVAEYYHLKPEDLRSSSRRHDVAYARQIAIYLARKLTSLSLSALGQEFGNRDHTTILHGLKKVEKKMKENRDFELLLISLERSLRR